MLKVSVDSNGNQGNNASTNPSISLDGNTVGFESLATNLGLPVQAGVNNVYVNDDLIAPEVNDLVYRFYNPVSRGHFFTTSTAERDTVLANPQWGYIFENIGFYAYGENANLGSDVYRFYNPFIIRFLKDISLPLVQQKEIRC